MDEDRKDSRIINTIACYFKTTTHFNFLKPITSNKQPETRLWQNTQQNIIMNPWTRMRALLIKCTGQKL